MPSRCVCVRAGYILPACPSPTRRHPPGRPSAQSISVRYARRPPSIRRILVIYFNDPAAYRPRSDYYYYYYYYYYLHDREIYIYIGSIDTRV